MNRSRVGRGWPSEQIHDQFVESDAERDERILMELARACEGPKADEQQEHDLRWVVAMEHHEPVRGNHQRFLATVRHRSRQDTKRRQEREAWRKSRTRSLDKLLEKNPIADPVDPLSVLEHADEVRAALSRFPARTALILNLRYIMSMSHREIASIVRSTPSEVADRLAEVGQFSPI